MQSAISPLSTVVNPAEDPDTLFEAGSIDMGRLDLDLSFLVQPSSLGEGASMTPALGMSSFSLLLGNLFHNRVILIMFLYSTPTFVLWYSSLS